jgi:hypothetical protein
MIGRVRALAIRMADLGECRFIYSGGDCCVFCRRWLPFFVVLRGIVKKFT